MKQILTTLTALLLMSAALMAQEKGRKDLKKQFQKDMNFSPAQQEQLKTMRQSMKEESKAIRNNAALSREDKKSKMKAIRERNQSSVKNILTPDQQAKWGQWAEKRRQFKKEQGARMQRKEMAKNLNLSKEQKSRMKELNKGMREKSESIRNNKSLTDAQRKEQLNALRMERVKMSKDLLSPEQIKMMQETRKKRQPAEGQPRIKQNRQPVTL